MTQSSARSFAHFGSEKMICDVRMGPQALRYEGAVTIAYQANPAGGKALPHVVSDDLETGEVVQQSQACRVSRGTR